MDHMADPAAEIPGKSDAERDRMLSRARQGSHHDVFTSGAPVAMMRTAYEAAADAGKIPFDPLKAAGALSGLETGIKLKPKSHPRVNGGDNGTEPKR
jgi:hypothetical protein